MFFKKKNAVCPVNVLFEVLDQDLKLGICCDVYFNANKMRHHFGAYGDDGNTYKNVHYFLDKQEYNSLEELREKALLENAPFVSYPGEVTVTECDGCYPEDDRILKGYIPEKKKTARGSSGTV